MAGSITSANAVLMLAIPRIFPVPQQIQGFAADDIFDMESINPSETVMGVDGKLSAGLINVPIPQNFSIQADSDSSTMFEFWYASMKAAQDTFFADGTISLPSINRSYVLTNGVLTGYSPAPDAKRYLQPRKFTITWESVYSAPF